mmetsp:Transcript_44073/g.138502  ORF Transcript_44073/g.138502 Transcript_44073/m.138502 type:complete len:294 (-) Transcript_44073:1212-2093(-)
MLATRGRCALGEPPGLPSIPGDPFCSAAFLEGRDTERSLGLRGDMLLGLRWPREFLSLRTRSLRKPGAGTRLPDGPLCTLPRPRCGSGDASSAAVTASPAGAAASAAPTGSAYSTGSSFANPCAPAPSGKSLVVNGLGVKGAGDIAASDVMVCSDGRASARGGSSFLRLAAVGLGMPLLAENVDASVDLDIMPSDFVRGVPDAERVSRGADFSEKASACAALSGLLWSATESSWMADWTPCSARSRSSNSLRRRVSTMAAMVPTTFSSIPPFDAGAAPFTLGGSCGAGAAGPW